MLRGSARAAVGAAVAVAVLAGCGGSHGLSSADKKSCRAVVGDGTGVEASMQAALIGADPHRLEASLTTGASRLRADVSTLADSDRVRVAVEGLAGAYAKQAAMVDGTGLVSTPLNPGIRAGIDGVSTACKSAFPGTRPG